MKFRERNYFKRNKSIKAIFEQKINSHFRKEFNELLKQKIKTIDYGGIVTATIGEGVTVTLTSNDHVKY